MAPLAQHQLLRSSSVTPRSVFKCVAPRKGTRPRSSRNLTTRIEARYSAGYNSTPDVADRVIAAVPYLLPFLNSIHHARYLMYISPFVRACLKPLFPMFSTFHSIPFAPLLSFFAIYLGLGNNSSMRRFVRFNAFQALLLDVVLIVPRLLEHVVTVPTTGWGAKAYVYGHSFIWIFMTIWVIYGMASSLLGQWGRIPFVSDAAEQQIR